MTPTQSYIRTLRYTALTSFADLLFDTRHPLVSYKDTSPASSLVQVLKDNHIDIYKAI